MVYSRKGKTYSILVEEVNNLIMLFATSLGKSVYA